MSTTSEKSILLLLLLVVSTSATVSFAQSTPPTTLAEVLDAAVFSLNNISSTAVDLLEQNACATAAQCSGSVSCSLPACGESFPADRGFQCMAAFGNSSSICGCAQGLQRSTEDSTVFLPPDHDFSNRASQRFLCATKGLNVEFDTNFRSNSLRSWQYVADMNGLTRVFPGTPQIRNSGVCDTFDVRRRPWFVSAVSGPKNVVVVIDSSGSMGSIDRTVTRMQLVKNAVSALLATFTIDDFVNVVEFNSNARTLLSDRLLRANTSTVDQLQSLVARVQAGGGTVFTTAFEKAFDLLEESSATTTCRNIILFLTDGHGNDPTEIIADRQNALQSKGFPKANIFTYSMSSGADKRQPQTIACNHNGVYNHIEDGDDPLEKLAQYYLFLRQTAVDGSVRWSSPYQDAFGMGTMITVARSIVETYNGNRVVSGVAAVDVAMSQFSFLAGVTTDDIENELVKRLSACPSGQVTQCFLHQLRMSAANLTCGNAALTETCRTSATAADPTSSCASLPNGLNSGFCSPLNATTRTPLMQEGYDTSELLCCANPVDRPASTAQPRLQCAATSLGGVLESSELEAFMFDPSCPDVLQCDMAACSCLGGQYASSGSVSIATSARDRCDISGTMLQNNSVTTCILARSCTKQRAQCLANTWRKHRDGATTTSCANWAMLARLAVANTLNGTATATSLCHTAICSVVHMLDGRASQCTLPTECELGCQNLALSQPAPTPAPPGVVSPGGGFNFGNTGASGYTMTTILVLSLLLVVFSLM